METIQVLHLSLCTIKNYAMKPYEGVEVQLHAR